MLLHAPVPSIQWNDTCRKDPKDCIHTFLPTVRTIHSAINYLEFVNCRLCVVWIGSRLGFSSRSNGQTTCELDVDFTLFQ